MIDKGQRGVDCVKSSTPQSGLYPGASTQEQYRTIEKMSISCVPAD